MALTAGNGHRKITAREAAARFNVTTRTIRNYVAEPREDYESRARAREQQILEWREQGMLWREIAERLNISDQAARKAGERARKRAA